MDESQPVSQRSRGETRIQFADMRRHRAATAEKMSVAFERRLHDDIDAARAEPVDDRLIISDDVVDAAIRADVVDAEHNEGAVGADREDGIDAPQHIVRTIRADAPVCDPDIREHVLHIPAWVIESPTITMSAGRTNRADCSRRSG